MLRHRILTVALLAASACGPRDLRPPLGVEDYCDFDRPRQDCTAEGDFYIDRLIDVRRLCRTPCTRLGDTVSIQAYDGKWKCRDALRAMKGFTYAEGVDIGSCATLTDLEGLEDLQVVDGDLHVHENPELVSLRGLEGLRKVESNGGETALDIERNPKLRNLDALDGLDGDGGVGIRYNASLETVRGFDGLTTATVVAINNNPALRRVSGFEHLTRLKYSLGITENPSLEDLSGFDALREVGTKVLVRDNERLPKCAADDFAAKFPDDVIVSTFQNGPPCD